MIVYISIGNSDDRLTQSEWSKFVLDMAAEVTSVGQVHGAWFSQPASPWQNACWCIEFPGDKEAAAAKAVASEIRKKYRQDSIAWAIAATEFV